MSYSAQKNRYQNMQYRNCGSSGLKLPLLSVGLWHNFGGNNGMASESKKFFLPLLMLVLHILT
jgi:L-glyceraldehyde 3-phosphate reductase